MYDNSCQNQNPFNTYDNSHRNIPICSVKSNVQQELISLSYKTHIDNAQLLHQLYESIKLARTMGVTCVAMATCTGI